jgi:phosphatidylinositol alpha-1,6-mannosyltransferase
MVKILFCSTEFPPRPGGIGNHAYGLAQELGKKYTCEVITEVRGSNAEFNEFCKKNLPLIKVVGITRFKPILLTYYQRCIEYYKKRNYKVQIFSGKFFVWLCAFSSKKINSIVVIHGSEIKQKGLSRYLFSLGLNKCKTIICVSDFTKNKLLNAYPNIVHKTIVINNGFIPDEIAIDRKVKSADLSLVTVGGVHKRKGQQNVIQALPELKKYFPKLIYHIVGIPQEKVHLMEIISGLKIEENVIFHGLLDENNKRKILRQADIFMMLSEELGNGDFEGFGIAILEAMNVGIPAIGTKQSGIADAISHNFSGKLVDHHDALEIVRAVIDIHNNYDIFSKNAQIWAKKFFWSSMAKEYCKVIEK